MRRNEKEKAQERSKKKEKKKEKCTTKKLEKRGSAVRLENTACHYTPQSPRAPGPLPRHAEAAV